MDPARIGRRIKELRIARQMTQQDLAGDRITRSMLSQIENGLASPSLKTLESLSRALGISQAELLAGPEPDRGSDPVGEAVSPGRGRWEDPLGPSRSALRSGAFLEAIQGAEAVLADPEAGPAREEARILLAHACLGAAREAARTGDADAAVRLARRSILANQESLYANSALRSEAALYLDRDLWPAEP